ncbi:MAG: hypothetical protein JNL05_10480 [Flavobacteriales bacterium]|nr:hypothetical protein [Flavobacteriales bacterium]
MDYGARRARGFFALSGLGYFAWSRNPLTLLMVHFAILATPAALVLWGVGTSAVWVVAPLAVLAMAIGYWVGMAWHRKRLVTRWNAQLKGDIMHKYFGWNEVRWPAQALAGYKAAAQITTRYAWLYSSSALGLVKGPNIIRMQWSNAAGDTVCLMLGETIEWWVAYGDTEHEAIPDESGSWDIEFDPPRPLEEALKLVSP